MTRWDLEARLLMGEAHVHLGHTVEPEPLLDRLHAEEQAISIFT